jgi:hypothetical protein
VLGPVGTGTSGTSPLELPDQLSDQLGGQGDQLAGDQLDEQTQVESAPGGTSAQQGQGEAAPGGTSGQQAQGGAASGDTGAQGGSTFGSSGSQDQGKTASANGGQQIDQNAESGGVQDQSFADTQQLSADEAQGGEAESKTKSDKEGNGKIDPSLRLINTAPINVDQSIDEPVTSGGDAVIGATPGPE